MFHISGAFYVVATVFILFSGILALIAYATTHLSGDMSLSHYVPGVAKVTVTSAYENTVGRRPTVGCAKTIAPLVK